MAYCRSQCTQQGFVLAGIGTHGGNLIRINSKYLVFFGKFRKFLNSYLLR